MGSLQLAFLYLAPWLALLLVLFAGRYPGERALARLARRRRPRSRRLRAGLVIRHRVVGLHRGGGLLLARRLAGRGPPRSIA